MAKTSDCRRKGEFNFKGLRLRLRKESKGLERLVLESINVCQVSLKPATTAQSGHCWGSYTPRGTIPLKVIYEDEIIFSQIYDGVDAGDLVCEGGNVYVVVSVENGYVLQNLSTATVCNMKNLAKAEIFRIVV